MSMTFQRKPMPRRTPLESDEPDGEGLVRWRPRCPPTPTAFAAPVVAPHKTVPLPSRDDLPDQVGPVQLAATLGVIIATLTARHDGREVPLHVEWVISSGSITVCKADGSGGVGTMTWAHRLTDIQFNEGTGLPPTFFMTVLADLEIAFLRARHDADLLAAADVTSIGPVSGGRSGTRNAVVATTSEHNGLTDLRAALDGCPWVRSVRRGTAADVRDGFDYLVTTADAGPLYAKVALTMAEADEYRRTHHRLSAFQRTVLVVLSVERADEARIARIGTELRRIYRRFGGSMTVDAPAPVSSSASTIPPQPIVDGGTPGTLAHVVPLRVLLFADAPDCLLIEAPPGATVTLPALHAPFDLTAVKAACHTSGTAIRVAEGTTTGRWTGAISRLRNDAKLERQQRAALELDAHVAQLRRQGDPESMTRAALHEEKVAVDERLRQYKGAILEAKTVVATRGVFMDPAKFRLLERNLEDEKQRSQEIQAALAKLNAARYEATSTTRHDASLRFVEKFYKVAKLFLDPEDFQDIVDAAKDEDGADTAPTDAEAMS